jgi:hypothetical protein
MVVYKTLVYNGYHNIVFCRTYLFLKMVSEWRGMAVDLLSTMRLTWDMQGIHFNADTWQCQQKLLKITQSSIQYN